MFTENTLATRALDLAGVFLSQKNIEDASLHVLQAALMTDSTGSSMMTSYETRIFRID